MELQKRKVTGYDTTLTYLCPNCEKGSLENWKILLTLKKGWNSCPVCGFNPENKLELNGKKD
jgi:uncharacterized protein (DUF983 family)